MSAVLVAGKKVRRENTRSWVGQHTVYYSPFRSFIAELTLNYTADVVVSVIILIRVVTQFIVVL